MTCTLLASMLLAGTPAGGATAALLVPSPEAPMTASRPAGHTAETSTSVSAPATPLPPASTEWIPPVCGGEVCQPRVWVPGFEPQFSIRGKRTELFLAALDHVELEPITTIAWYVAASGFEFDYTPGNLDGPAPGGRIGWGHVAVYFRWRIDAWNQPVFPRRHVQ